MIKGRRRVGQVPWFLRKIISSDASSQRHSCVNNFFSKYSSVLELFSIFSENKFSKSFYFSPKNLHLFIRKWFYNKLLLEWVQIQRLAAMLWKDSSLGLVSLCPEPGTRLTIAAVAASFLGFRLGRWGGSECRHTWTCARAWDFCPAGVQAALFPGQGNTWHPECS